MNLSQKKTLRPVAYMKYTASFVMIMSLMLPWCLWAADEESESQGFELKGYVSSKYVSRESKLSEEKVDDADIYGQLRLDLSSPEKKYEAHFFGTARNDLDGDEESNEFSIFEDFGQVGKSEQKGAIYEAHFDLNQAMPNLKQIKIGRQSSTRDMSLYFDGLSADFKLGRKLGLIAYGGRSVRFFESDPGDDSLGGAGIDYSFSPLTSFSLDYLSTKDERVDENEEMKDRQDDMVSLKLWQRFSNAFKGTFKYRWINSEPRDLNLSSLILLSNSQTSFNFNYFRQFLIQNELSEDLSSFHDLIGQTHPFQVVKLNLRQPFGSHYALDLGYLERSLVEEEDEGSFNREFKRTFILFETFDRIHKGLNITVFGERWSGETEVDSSGWDIGYHFDEKLNKAKVSAGSYYSLYKYDYFSDRGEKTDVRTYYVKGNFPFGQSFAVNGSYEREESLDDYNVYKLGVRYDF
ncbi:MAG: hypothetical protein HQM13_20465 [SAR324 cluster bacterium]|nr:hypothetical protein [SAR324 cluster bacterium]